MRTLLFLLMMFITIMTAVMIISMSNISDADAMVERSKQRFDFYKRKR